MINLETARRVIETAEKKAVEIKQPMNIAVVDAGGNLVAPGATSRVQTVFHVLATMATLRQTAGDVPPFVEASISRAAMPDLPPAGPSGGR
jgi:uncharacterized protein GlcG (DUF336 family)